MRFTPKLRSASQIRAASPARLAALITSFEEARMFRARGLRQLALGGCFAALLAYGSPVRADAISDWIAIAADATTVRGQGDSYRRSRVMAAVSIAMFEAVSINEAGKGSWIMVSAQRPLGASSEAAAAAAAHYVLSRVFPEQQVSFSVNLVRSLEAIPDGEGKFVGQMVGTSIGKNIYALLATDL
jgi:hypothetical protein